MTPNSSDSWDDRDREALSHRFLVRATDAERYAKECRGKIGRTASYKRLHDEALAEYYVANRLHGRTFLRSREALLNELQGMLELDFGNVGAFDDTVFKRHYKAEVTRLIEEFVTKAT